MTGASPFPRHWICDAAGQRAARSGLANFKYGTDGSGTRLTSCGGEDSPALVTALETALERVLSVQLMHGATKPAFATLAPGDKLVRQGESGSEVYLVLDGEIRADRDGAQLAEYGPGAILGERGHLEAGVRTCTLLAVAPCRVAAEPAGQFAAEALIELATGHRHEEAVQGG